MDPIKLKAVKDWPQPKTVKDIQKFLGFCNFYRRFIKNYSKLVAGYACTISDTSKSKETSPKPQP
jgi:hypothetical protein